MPFHPLVSCIIPIYNAEEYIDQGIQSLLSQTYQNLEIILVDDRSTDSSWEICQKYAKQHDNIRVFKMDKNSGGPLRGRERGINESRGEWITFMDCDDYVSPKYIENLLKTTKNGRYDIAVTGHSRLYEDGTVEEFKWANYTQTTQERLTAFYEHYFLAQDYWTDPTDTVGQNLIRASVAKKTDLSKYPNTVYGEDSLMALAFLENSNNGVNFLDHHDFYWRQRPGSGSHGGFSTTANRPELYRAFFDIFKRNNVLPLVSIIIPIYNVETYLKSCIDSVLAQTYPNTEIILVDDESPDMSGAIADKYAKKEKRVQVIHKQNNEGLNMARATGFRASSGEYVLFVDSDDLLTEDCIETVLRTLLKNQTDFVRFGMLTFRDKKDLAMQLTNIPPAKQIVLKGKKELYMSQFDQAKVLDDLPMFSMTVCGAIYTSKLVGKVDWKDTNYRAFEDNIWTLRYLENASSGTYISYIGYLYRFHESITNVLNKCLTGNTFNGKPIGYLECWSYIWNEYRRYNIKYKVGADEIVENTINHLLLFRASHITKANLWDAENNAKYLPEVTRSYQDKLNNMQQHILTKDIYIHGLESEISRLSSEHSAMQAELNSHLSIKRSAKLTIGNIKRRVNHGNVAERKDGK